jgi:hypothetical protein
MVEAIIVGIGIIFFGTAFIGDGLAHKDALRRIKYCRAYGCYVDPNIGTRQWMCDNGMEKEMPEGSCDED